KTGAIAVLPTLRALNVRAANETGNAGCASVKRRSCTGLSGDASYDVFELSRSRDAIHLCADARRFVLQTELREGDTQNEAGANVEKWNSGGGAIHPEIAPRESARGFERVLPESAGSRNIERAFPWHGEHPVARVGR